MASANAPALFYLSGHVGLTSTQYGPMGISATQALWDGGFSGFGGSNAFQDPLQFSCGLDITYDEIARSFDAQHGFDATSYRYNAVVPRPRSPRPPEYYPQTLEMGIAPDDPDDRYDRQPGDDLGVDPMVTIGHRRLDLDYLMQYAAPPPPPPVQIKEYTVPAEERLRALGLKAPVPEHQKASPVKSVPKARKASPVKSVPKARKASSRVKSILKGGKISPAGIKSIPRGREISPIKSGAKGRVRFSQKQAAIYEKNAASLAKPTSTRATRSTRVLSPPLRAVPASIFVVGPSHYTGLASGSGSGSAAAASPVAGPSSLREPWDYTSSCSDSDSDSEDEIPTGYKYLDSPIGVRADMQSARPRGDGHREHSVADY